MTIRLAVLQCALAAAALAGEETEADGAAPWWRDHGINFGSGFSWDSIYETHGDSWLHNLDAGLWVEADLGSLMGADHWYAYASPSLVWGAEEDWEWKARIYQAWLSWDGSDHFNAFAGMLDPGWFFHSMPSTAAFVRLPARTTGEFSPGGLGLLDLYPVSAPALRLEWKPGSFSYVQAAAFRLDGNDEIRGRTLAAGAEGFDRMLTLVETGWRDEGAEDTGWKHRVGGIGGWWLPEGDGSWGTYVFADVKLWAEPQLDWQGLSGFASASIAKADGYGHEHRWVAGLAYEGLFPTRDEDTTSLAVIVEQGDEKTTNGDRHAWELLHRFRLNDHWWLQWALQRQDGETREWRNGLRIGCDF